MRQDISAGSIVGGSITLSDSTDYYLTSDLLLDGVSFTGFVFDGAGTNINVYGQGYIITVTNTSFAGLFSQSVYVCDITLVNHVNALYLYTDGVTANNSATNFFISPFSQFTDIGLADVSGDGYIYLNSGRSYRLTGDLTVVPSAEEYEGGNIYGFKVGYIEGEFVGNVVIDCSHNTITTYNTDSIFTQVGSQGLLVKNLICDASGNTGLESGNGWIFGQGFIGSIAQNCTVTCGNIGKNSGGIFGGTNANYVVATYCNVNCGTLSSDISETLLLGGTGGICGGHNTESISFASCTVVVTGDVLCTTYGGSGGICGGMNYASMMATNCVVYISGDVSTGYIPGQTGGGGSGGICGGGNNKDLVITITSCDAKIRGDVSYPNTDQIFGGCGGILGGSNGSEVRINACSAVIDGDIVSYGSEWLLSGCGGICGGMNNTGNYTISKCVAQIKGNIQTPVDSGILGIMNNGWVNLIADSNIVDISGDVYGGLIISYKDLYDTPTLSVSNSIALLNDSVQNHNITTFKDRGKGGGGGKGGGEAPPTIYNVLLFRAPGIDVDISMNTTGVILTPSLDTQFVVNGVQRDISGGTYNDGYLSSLSLTDSSDYVISTYFNSSVNTALSGPTTAYPLYNSTFNIQLTNADSSPLAYTDFNLFNGMVVAATGTTDGSGMAICDVSSSSEGLLGYYVTSSNQLSSPLYVSCFYDQEFFENALTNITVFSTAAARLSSTSIALQGVDITNIITGASDTIDVSNCNLFIPPSTLNPFTNSRTLDLSGAAPNDLIYVHGSLNQRLILSVEPDAPTLSFPNPNSLTINNITGNIDSLFVMNGIVYAILITGSMGFSLVGPFQQGTAICDLTTNAAYYYAGETVTLFAKLKLASNGNPIIGQRLTISYNNLTDLSGTTDASGSVRMTFPAANTYMSFTPIVLGSSFTPGFVEIPWLTLTSDQVSYEEGELVTVTAHLTNGVAGADISGKLLTFNYNSVTYTSTTDASGNADISFNGVSTANMLNVTTGVDVNSDRSLELYIGVSPPTTTTTTGGQPTESDPLASVTITPASNSYTVGDLVTLNVTVINDAMGGQPLAGARVSITYDGDSFASGITDASGRTTIFNNQFVAVSGITTYSITSRIGFLEGANETLTPLTVTEPPSVPCFLASAPVLTPNGYVKIYKLSAGDEVITGDGRTVTIQQVKRTTALAGPYTNPYIIQKSQFGATKRLLISPNHRVQTEKGLVEARHLGLKQEALNGYFDYYNLELPNWERDTLVVAGVTVESMAPIRRVTVTLRQLAEHLIQKYGKVTPELMAKIKRTCRLVGNDHVNIPTLKK